MSTLSPDKRFEIHLFTRDDDSYFYSSTEYYWYITSVETGDELFSFRGTSSQDSSGSKETGMNNVYFSNDGLGIVALLYDGSQNSYPLPARIDIVENGERLQLTFPDGTEQHVPRKKLIHFSKYGQAFGPPIKNDPGKTKRT